MMNELLAPPEIETFVYPKYFKERVPFVSSECEFTPCGWTEIEGKLYPLGYKIVKGDMTSLGLRKNPNIMTFAVGEWIMLSDEEVITGICDEGGIWTALKKGSIKTLKNYMFEMYGTETRAFLTAIDRPIYANSYRIKSQGVMLLEEIL